MPELMSEGILLCGYSEMTSLLQIDDNDLSLGTPEEFYEED